jgi:peptidyl-prolyl isomerase D
VYGRVIHGWGICETAEYVEKGANDKPLNDVTIADCGELVGEDKMTLENCDFIKTYTEEKLY